MRSKNLYIRATQNIHHVPDEAASEKSVPPVAYLKQYFQGVANGVL